MLVMVISLTINNNQVEGEVTGMWTEHVCAYDIIMYRKTIF